MLLSKKAIEDLRRIYFMKYNVTLTDAQANDMGLKILRFYEFKYRDDRHSKI